MLVRASICFATLLINAHGFLQPVAIKNHRLSVLQMNLDGDSVSPAHESRSQLGKSLRRLKVASFLLLTIPGIANAGFFQSSEQDSVDELSRSQKPIAELLDLLRPTVQPNAVGVYATTQVR
jgi:hypothetical protein